MLTSHQTSRQATLRNGVFIAMFSPNYEGDKRTTRDLEIVMSNLLKPLSGNQRVELRAVPEDNNRFYWDSIKLWPPGAIEEASRADGFMSIFLALADSDIDRFVPVLDRFVLFRLPGSDTWDDTLVLLDQVARLLPDRDAIFRWHQEQATLAGSSGVVRHGRGIVSITNR